LHFTKSSVTIYSVTCDTFVDADPSYVTEDRGVKSGTIGYYDQNGNLKTENVSYTLSEDTALNAANEEVHYVESITFPLTYESDKYYLTLYINSNVMGVQFCNSNDKATTATYPAVFTVNWDTISGNGSSKASENTAGHSSESAERNTPENNSATVVEEDGLNIHYANKSETPPNPVSYTAYLNTNGLIIIGICASVVIIAGIVLLISGKKRKADRT
ncbi:MAG: hypothetical protein LBQ68_08850, partial [Clostridiales bacterium]|jgi:hypothetical protein|nr:hypothetical protein [Clostridiales bacterium]